MATTTVPYDSMASMLALPAAMPPPGVVANLHNPPSQVPLASALFAVTFTIMTLAVWMRLSVRWFINRALVIEDGLVLVAWALMIAYGVCSHELGKIEFTVHMWDETWATYVHGKELVTIISIIYNFIIIFLKTAILAQLIRIFAPNRINLVIFYACWALIIVNVAVFVIDSILSLVRCSPVEKNWNPFIPGHCRFSEFSFRMSTPAVNVGTDALILVLPLPYIYKLHIDRKKKLLVSGLFAVGALATASSTVRLYYTYVVLKREDPTWHYAYQGIATWFEVSMGSLVVCLPMAPRLLQFLREKIDTLQRSRKTADLERGNVQPSTERDNGSPPMAMPDARGVSSFRQYLGANSISLFTDNDRFSRIEDEEFRADSAVDPPNNDSKTFVTKVEAVHKA